MDELALSRNFGKVQCMAKGKRVLTTGDVARICNVSGRIAVKWVDEGLLKGYRIPFSRDRRIPVSELDIFLRTHGMPIEEFLEEFKDVL